MISSIKLLDNLNGKHVEASLHDRIKPELALKAEASWFNFMKTAKINAQALNKPAPNMEHEGWLWHKKVEESFNLLPFPTLAIECSGEIQGLMLLQTDASYARLPIQRYKPIVYIEMLSTAPWNLEEFTAQPKYSGVGVTLLAAAINISMDYGFKGRIGLHSLPQAETYYERHKFDCLGIDSSKQHLKYYELSDKNASEFLK